MILRFHKSVQVSQVPFALLCSTFSSTLSVFALLHCCEVDPSYAVLKLAELRLESCKERGQKEQSNKRKTPLRIHQHWEVLHHTSVMDLWKNEYYYTIKYYWIMMVKLIWGSAGANISHMLDSFISVPHLQ